MRIITGSLKGRTIPFTARKGSVRLTGAMLKEAVFAMLGPALAESTFVDFCAGSGQMGFEASSRGAAVLFNEPDRRRFGQIKSLVRQWRLADVELFSEKAQVLMDRLAEENRTFDTIYQIYHQLSDTSYVPRDALNGEDPTEFQNPRGRVRRRQLAPRRGHCAWIRWCG